MTVEQDYLRRIDELDTEITKLRKQRQSLFIEYMPTLQEEKTHRRICVILSRNRS